MVVRPLAGAAAGGDARAVHDDEHFRRFSFLVFYGILRAIRDDRYCPLQIYPCKLFLTLPNIAKNVGAIQCHNSSLTFP